MNPFDNEINSKHMAKEMNNNPKSLRSTSNSKSKHMDVKHTENKSVKSKSTNVSRNKNNNKKLNTPKNKTIINSVDSGYTRADIRAMDSKYSTDRLNLHILNILKRFQHMTGDSSRSKLLYRLTKIAYPKIMNTDSKRKEYKKSGKLAITNLKFSHKI